MTDTQTGEVQYCKNARAYGKENNVSTHYIHELISKNRTYRNKTYERITKQCYEENSK